MFPSFAYVRAADLKEAVDRLASDKAQVHAGGTDLLGCLRDEVFSVDTVVSLSDIKGMSGVSENDDGSLVIGALTTVTEIENHPLIRERFPGLAQAAAEVASPQLRNQGTLGGNLCQKPRCWYYRGDFDCLRKGGSHCFAVTGENEYHCIFGGANCFIVHPSDIAPMLVALDAQLRVVGPKGTRYMLASQLHMPPEQDPTRETTLDTGELITEVRIPAPTSDMYTSYRKIRTRRSWDFAIAGCALALQREGETIRDCRVVLSGAAPIPWRSQAAERVLRGSRLDDQTIEQAAAAAVAQATPMSNNAYKVPLFRGMLEEELREAKV